MARKKFIISKLIAFLVSGNERMKTKILISFGLGLIILDRLSKWFVLKNPDFYSGRFIELKLFKNTNLYFLNINPIFLNLIIGAVLLLLVFLFFKTLKQENFLFQDHMFYNSESRFCRAKRGRFLLTFGFSLIILGGFSNLFDRLYFGYVIDWIRIFILPISIFNIADVMIIGGVVCLILALAVSDTASTKSEFNKLIYVNL